MNKTHINLQEEWKKANEAQSVPMLNVIISDLLKELEQHQWVSVKDRLPKNGETVIAYKGRYKTRIKTMVFLSGISIGQVNI